MFHFCRLLATSIILSATCITANAGDFADFRPLGFSKDGSVFAFEQFGIQDGSGFPYAERYFIHTKSDTYVKGTPFKVRIEDEDAGIKQARDAVNDASAHIMAQYGIGDIPARIVAFNPSTERNATPYKIAYHRFAYEPNPNQPLELDLSIIDLPPSQMCSGIIETAKGFKLELTQSPDSDPIVIHQDKSIPKSRNCPIDYRLGGVLTFDDFNGPSIQIFLILVKSYGFEGPDGRWIAIATHSQS